MILYSDNKNKLVVLFVLVALVTGVITWQWLKFAPWQLAIAEPSEGWQEIKTETKDSLNVVGNSLGVVRDEFINLQIDLIKDQQQQELLEAANQYIENKNNSDEE